jgi:hypothetical protein
MKLTKNILSLILLAIGAVWSLQGAGFVGGSFMTGQSQWLYIGSQPYWSVWADWYGQTVWVEPPKALADSVWDSRVQCRRQSARLC